MCLHFQVKIRHIILSNTFHMNVLSNMLLEGLSARVLQLAPNFPLVLPTYTLRLLSLSVSCRLLSRNYVQTSRDLSTGPRPAQKCDAFGTDMRSRMSAPGTSCSKETVLRIEFMMDHHRDYWARCNMCYSQNEAGWFAYASWSEVRLNVFAGYRRYRSL